MTTDNFGMLYSNGGNVAIGAYHDRNIDTVNDWVIITNEGLVTTGKYEVVGVDEVYEL